MTRRTVAVTGAGGRLGTELVKELRLRSIPSVTWSRPEYDLDHRSDIGALIERDRPGLVIHCAVWSDADGCARAPELAMRRNGHAVGELATICARAGIRMILISTNEIFDGLRTDGHGYSETDLAVPLNSYGMSKLAGEQLAQAAYDEAGHEDALRIVRTAWLYGPSGRDFPARILTASDGLSAGDSLRVVDDEIGSPTYTPDLAFAILDLAERAPGGVYHLVNSGQTTRFEWAEAVLRSCRDGRPGLRAISRVEFQRDSTPPAWAVLDAGAAAGRGITMRNWRVALADDLALRCPAQVSARC